jgi:hypothetical protein
MGTIRKESRNYLQAIAMIMPTYSIATSYGTASKAIDDYETMKETESIYYQQMLSILGRWVEVR